MILIPKPGKPPDPENLRPISLTSCVGKVLEHVLLNRWQKYLERIEAFPHTIIGFRQHLGTQDAMLQLKHQVIDGQTSGNKAILGLDVYRAHLIKSNTLQSQDKYRNSTWESAATTTLETF